MTARLLPYVCFIVLMLLVCMEAQAGLLGHTPDDEVKALREIAGQLGKRDWKFSIDPCLNDSTSSYKNSVFCNCDYPGGVCHIERIFLRGEDLAGILPPALLQLPYLKKMSFTGNNLSGPIPTYLGNMTTLKYLSIENNLFSGNVPPELGNLVNLETLILSANNLTGELPTTLTRLNKLTEFRISSNNFTGKFPDFFQNWTKLKKLEIQGSGLKGPIPSSISVLINLTELKISDLHGEGSYFPALMNMTNMTELTLRGCNMSGEIPAYIPNMTHLGKLDLSFNRLEKEIPEFEGLENLTNMYLTGNLLTGDIPNWIRNSKQNIDLSYNNLARCPKDTCTGTILNLFKSFHGQENSTLGVCPEDNQCFQDYYSSHINCGGSSTTIGCISYEEDTDPGGASKFYEAGDKWGFSSTGDFQNATKNDQNYITNNVSVLKMHDYKLYMSARVSPLSLTYFVRCLANGKYTVKLHFAEIVLRGDKSSYSLGRRIFDVYIQGELKLKDFDIEKEAEGVDRAIIKNIAAVSVTNKSLEIRFHWAGKGTTAALEKGTYGPLISAISVKSNFRASIGRKSLQLEL